MTPNRLLSALALSTLILAGAPACASAQDVVRTARTEPAVTEARAQTALTPAAASAAAFDQISDTLDRAAAAWSEGNVEDVMGFYDQDQPLLVLMGDLPLKGPEPVREQLTRMAARQGGLGVMNYEWFETMQLDAHTAVVSGRMVVSRNGVHHRGLFTRVLRRTADGWRILHDQMAIPSDA